MSDRVGRSKSNQNRMCNGDIYCKSESQQHCLSPQKHGYTGRTSGAGSGIGWTLPVHLLHNESKECNGTVKVCSCKAILNLFLQDSSYNGMCTFCYAYHEIHDICMHTMRPMIYVSEVLYFNRKWQSSQLSLILYQWTVRMNCSLNTHQERQTNQRALCTLRRATSSTLLSPTRCVVLLQRTSEGILSCC